jgi:hypothetical protein
VLPHYCLLVFRSEFSPDTTCKIKKNSETHTFFKGKYVGAECFFCLLRVGMEAMELLRGKDEVEEIIAKCLGDKYFSHILLRIIETIFTFVPRR